MKLYSLIFSCLTLLPALSALAQAEISDFRVISQRNIFDQTRKPQRTNQTAVAQTPQLVDAFSLVGIMDYEKGRFAFFDGTRTDYRKVVKPDETIGGYKLVAVLPTSVRLETAGKQFEMKMGMQLRRDSEIAQLIADGITSGSYSNSSSSLAPALTASSASSGGAPGADANDILKKLMQKREQELK